MKAKNGFVLLEKLEENEKTEGGIIIPDSAKDKAQTKKGKIFVADKELEMKKGEVVLYNTTGEIEWEVDKEKKYLVHISKIYLSDL